ncbi:MAG: peptidoglycan editing factor PgeF [Candidatus Omnitrophota bacterium]|nr:peptidoglycan editing factor PgeF [Candidatus Omnitrophota bacterium]
MISNLLDKVGVFRIFSGYPVIASFSDRNLDLGFDCPDYKKNRKEFLRLLDIDYDNLVCAKQIHSANVVEVCKKDAGGVIPDTDALITKAEHLALAVFTADCPSVFIYDSRNNAIGLVHAGWRGSKDKILQKALMLMRQKFGTEPKDLFCAFGPAIHACCYEIGPDVAAYFPEGVTIRNNKRYLDLALVNQNQLLGLGVKKSQIEDSAICTVCSNVRYFSYRKEKEESGRMMSVMVLK